mgnify:FL=1
MFIVSPDWNPTNEIQAIARAHRMGQVDEVQVHRFNLQPNKLFNEDSDEDWSTIDQRINSRQQEKRYLMASLLKDDSLLPSSFTPEDKLDFLKKIAGV